MVSKTLIYVYSMETFVYADLKKACLNRDYSRVKTLGPYAWAVGEIIYGANKKKLKFDLDLRKKYKT